LQITTSEELNENTAKLDKIVIYAVERQNWGWTTKSKSLRRGNLKH